MSDKQNAIFQLQNTSNLQKTMIMLLNSNKYFQKIQNSMTFEILAQNVQYKKIKQGSIIYEQGETPRYFYIILEGQVLLVAENQIQKNNDTNENGQFQSNDQQNTSKEQEIEIIKLQKFVEQNEYFGNLEIIFNRTRFFSAITTKQTTLLYFDRKIYEQFLMQTDRYKYNKKVKIMKNLFESTSLTRFQLILIYLQYEKLKCCPKQKIFTQGDKSDSIYFLKKGEVKYFQMQKVELVKIKNQQKDNEQDNLQIMQLQSKSVLNRNQSNFKELSVIQNAEFFGEEFILEIIRIMKAVNQSDTKNITSSTDLQIQQFIRPYSAKSKTESTIYRLKKQDLIFFLYNDQIREYFNQTINAKQDWRLSLIQNSKSAFLNISKKLQIFEMKQNQNKQQQQQLKIIVNHSSKDFKQKPSIGYNKYSANCDIISSYNFYRYRKLYIGKTESNNHLNDSQPQCLIQNNSYLSKYVNQTPLRNMQSRSQKVRQQRYCNQNQTLSPPSYNFSQKIQNSLEQEELPTSQYNSQNLYQLFCLRKKSAYQRATASSQKKTQDIVNVKLTSQEFMGVRLKRSPKIYKNVKKIIERQQKNNLINDSNQMNFQSQFNKLQQVNVQRDFIKISDFEQDKNNDKSFYNNSFNFNNWIDLQNKNKKDRQKLFIQQQ